AAAIRIDRLAIAVGRWQGAVRRAVDRYRLLHGLAGVAIHVETDLGRRAGLAAGLFILGKAGRGGGMRDRVVVSVTGTHASRAVGTGGRREARLRLVRRRGRRPGAEQRFKNAATRRARSDRLLILRAAIILCERHQDGPALAAAHIGLGVAAQPFELGLDL